MKQNSAAKTTTDKPANQPVSQIEGLESLQGWRRLHIRLTILYGGITLLVLALLATSVFIHGMRSELLSLQQRLLATVESLASSTDGEAIAALPGEAKDWTSLHHALFQRFRLLANADRQVQSIYILKPTQEPTALRFFVDYVKKGSRGKPGDRYDASNVPLMLTGFDRPVVEDHPVSDQFGITLSAYAPVKTFSGRSVAVVGVDVNASSLAEIRNGLLLRAAFSFGLALILLAIVATLIAKNLRRSFNSIIGASTAISRGDLSARIRLQRRDEFGLMSQHLDQMIVAR